MLVLDHGIYNDIHAANVLSYPLLNNKTSIVMKGLSSSTRLYLSTCLDAPLK